MFEYFQYLTERATSSNEDDPKDNFGDCDGDDGWVPLWESCRIVEVWNLSRLQHLQLEKQHQVSVDKRLIRSQNHTIVDCMKFWWKIDETTNMLFNPQYILRQLLENKSGRGSDKDLMTGGKRRQITRSGTRRKWQEVKIGRELIGWSKVTNIARN